MALRLQTETDLSWLLKLFLDSVQNPNSNQSLLSFLQNEIDPESRTRSWIYKRDQKQSRLVSEPLTRLSGASRRWWRSEHQQNRFSSVRSQPPAQHAEFRGGARVKGCRRNLMRLLPGTSLYQERIMMRTRCWFYYGPKSQEHHTDAVWSEHRS